MTSHRVTEPARVWGSSGDRTRGGAWLALVLLSLAMAGCAVVRPGLLEVPPGYRVVLGRIDLSRFAASEALLEIVRDDGAIWLDLRVGAGRQDFVITLPPGRYRISRLRLVDDRQASPTHTILYLQVGFEVGPEPAVYVGTLRLLSALGGQKLDVTVADEYEQAVPALRARQPGIPETVARSLFRPA